MRSLRACVHRLTGLFRRRSREVEMQAEMQSHLDALTERNIAIGLSAEEAHYAALRTFGGVSQLAEKARDEWRLLWLEQLGQDIRYAVRALRKSPTFTITAVLTLALGIGVNTALFSTFNLVALRPLPVSNPDNLVRVYGLRERGGITRRFRYADYIAFRETTSALSGLMAFVETRWSFRRQSGAEPATHTEARWIAKVPIVLVSENYFSVLGGPIQLGRPFLPSDFRSTETPVVVLSHAFWQSQFDRNPNVIGTTVKFDSRAVTIVGVTSPDFSGHDAVPPAGWLPLPLWSSLASDYEPNGPPAFGLIGRVKEGVSTTTAKAELDLIAARRAAEFPAENVQSAVRLERGLHMIDFNRGPNVIAGFGAIFFGFLLVLVIACTNVTNLLLARGVSRQAELGMRLTLGASRGRVVRQLLTENLLLCLIGGALGLAFAVWTLQLFLPVVVSRLPVDWAMDSRNLKFFKTTPDVRVISFTAILTLGATLVSGLLPAWHAAGASLFAVSRNEGTAFGRKLRQMLVIAQVAISLSLLSCAGQLARNLFERQKGDIGFDAHAVFDVAIMPNATMPDRSEALRQALAAVSEIPGVASSAVASGAPPMGAAARPRIRLVDAKTGGAEEQINASFVSERFFNAFSIPLRGRTFTRLELNSASRAIIVSESVARQLWPGQEATGKTLAVSEAAWGTRERPALPDTFRDCEVIGVVGDVMMSAAVDDRRMIYLPYTLDVATNAPLFIKPRSDSPAALAEIVRAANAEGIELQFNRRHSFWVEFALLPHYAFAIVSGALGALALGMASVGLYGLMAFAVNQRVREIGIRMALGAQPSAVVSLFMRRGVTLVAIGLVFGMIGGGVFGLLLGKVFFGLLKGFDPLSLGIVGVLFAGIAVLACWLPARRATKVDPMVALRAE
jgi:macrolide transport system ATP-binding/permease protein